MPDLFGSVSSTYDVVCKICGKHEKSSLLAWICDILNSRKMCYDCYHWTRHREEGLKGGSLVFEGQGYTVGPEPPLRNKRGSNGEEFKIKLLPGGRVVKTRNLWPMGAIPERFRESLPDNCVITPTKKKREPVKEVEE